MSDKALKVMKPSRAPSCTVPCPSHAHTTGLRKAGLQHPNEVSGLTSIFSHCRSILVTMFKFNFHRQFPHEFKFDMT